MLQLLATICLGLNFSMATSVGPGDVPGDLEKWIETDPPKDGTGRWRVANYDIRHEWVVALRDDRPKVRLRDRTDEAPAPLPFDVEPYSSKQRRFSIKVTDGWIVAYNAGEWGGAIWWYSPDGQERYKISEAGVHGFIPTEEGLLALEGLAHMRRDKGRILRLTEAPGGRWKSEDFVDLKHAPEVCVKAADGSLIVATTRRLLRVVPASKKVEVILDDVFWGGLYPNSMVITPAGVTYLGMRHGVAKVEKEKGGSRRLRWLLPNKAFDEKEIDE